MKQPFPKNGQIAHIAFEHSKLKRGGTPANSRCLRHEPATATSADGPGNESPHSSWYENETVECYQQ